MRPRVIQFCYGARLRAVERDCFALHDVGLAARNLRQPILVDAVGLAKRVEIKAAHVVADAKRAMLAVKTIVECEDGMARRGPEGMNGVTMAFGEIPEVAGSVV